MNIEKCWHVIKQEIANIDDRRSNDFDLLLRCLVLAAEDVVDEFKESREFHKKKNSKFQFWTYVPSVSRGAATVVIRWRKYSGHGRFSDSVATSVLTNYRIPMSVFQKTTRAEKRAIVHAEAQFAKIRKIGEQLITIGQAHNAMIDIAGARPLKKGFYVNDTKSEEDEQVDKNADNTSINETKEFTERERDEWRRRNGLPPRYS
ncbi:conjugative transfer protein MobI(A/C) [Marinobacter lacisalsi]|uniref:Conjugative transfer protein MobI(A/C) n=1 Tax=Marinobacter lacisalsi TaxID=475979 RepID=A0ABV8QJ87_9GAMM